MLLLLLLLLLLRLQLLLLLRLRRRRMWRLLLRNVPCIIWRRRSIDSSSERVGLVRLRR